MGSNTKAIIRKGTTLLELKECLESNYESVEIASTHSDDFFRLIFNDGKDRRCLNIFLKDTAKNDYDIDGVLLDLGSHGNSVKIMKTFLEKFGGYLDENDCDDEDFYSINLNEFKKGKKFSKQDLLIQRIIQKLGYENLKITLEIFKEFK